MTVRFNDDFLGRYVHEAPLALAVERWFECTILSQQEWIRPILDIGCGDGVFSSVLFDDPIDVGIDPDSKEISRAAQYGKYNELINCFGQAIDKPAASFNTIFSNSVLEHIQDIRPVLDEAKRLLAPTGRFYVTVPSDLFDHYNWPYQALSLARLDTAAERYRKFFNRFWKHYHCYTPDGWTQLFAEAGFDVVSHQEYCPKSICLLNDLLAPLGGPSMVAKKLTGKWFPFKGVRDLYAPVLKTALQPMLDVDPSLKGGGILFFALAHSR
ncbi:MAG TPA: class I SAM-dependent methyltransferase [Kofleriaceae bacterium]|jgi:SAM-dependent methyltransferase